MDEPSNALSENNHTQILVERAPRGRILDRHGEVLADDQPVFVALFSPLGLDPQTLEPLAKRLSGILNIQGPELQKRIFAAVRAKSMMRISDRLTRPQAFQVLQETTHLPGISLTIEEQRYYPKGQLASHVLGYVGEITDDELDQFAEQGYHGGDWIGKSGIERLYDPLLHGQDGGFLIEGGCAWPASARDPAHAAAGGKRFWCSRSTIKSSRSSRKKNCTTRGTRAPPSL